MLRYTTLYCTILYYNYTNIILYYVMLYYTIPYCYITHSVHAILSVSNNFNLSTMRLDSIRFSLSNDSHNEDHASTVQRYMCVPIVRSIVEFFQTRRRNLRVVTLQDRVCFSRMISSVNQSVSEIWLAFSADTSLTYVRLCVIHSHDEEVFYLRLREIV